MLFKNLGKTYDPLGYKNGQVFNLSIKLQDENGEMMVKNFLEIINLLSATEEDLPSDRLDPSLLRIKNHGPRVLKWCRGQLFQSSVTWGSSLADYFRASIHLIFLFLKLN